MKNIINYLPAMAILLACSLAMAAAKPTVAPQYYKNCATGTWRFVQEDGIVMGTQPGQASCVDDPVCQCTAEGFDNLGNPIEVVTGILIINP